MFFHARNSGGCQRDGEETAGGMFLGVNKEARLEICKWETFLILCLDSSNWHVMAEEVV